MYMYFIAHNMGHSVMYICGGSSVMSSDAQCQLIALFPMQLCPTEDEGVWQGQQCRQQYVSTSASRYA